MYRIIQSALGAAAIGATSLFGFAGAGTADAQQQEGLVNVNITDVTVQVPIAVAANVCGLDVNVLAEQVAAAPVDCDADADATADGNITPASGGPVQQEGLVNLNLQDVIIQAPIGVAANICGVDVNILARQLDFATATCESVADPDAGA